MLKQQRALDDVFKALSDAGRRRILEELTRGEAPMGALTAPLAMSLSGVHQHVAVLKSAGLVACEKRGRERWCRLDAKGLVVAEGWIRDRQRLWEQRFDNLAAHLEREAKAGVRKTTAKKKGKR